MPENVQFICGNCFYDAVLFINSSSQFSNPGNNYQTDNVLLVIHLMFTIHSIWRVVNVFLIPVVSWHSVKGFKVWHHILDFVVSPDVRCSCAGYAPLLYALSATVGLLLIFVMALGVAHYVSGTVTYSLWTKRLTHRILFIEMVDTPVFAAFRS